MHHCAECRLIKAINRKYQRYCVDIAQHGIWNFQSRARRFETCSRCTLNWRVSAGEFLQTATFRRESAPSLTQSVLPTRDSISVSECLIVCNCARAHRRSVRSVRTPNCISTERATGDLLPLYAGRIIELNCTLTCVTLMCAVTSSLCANIARAGRRSPRQYGIYRSICSHTYDRM